MLSIIFTRNISTNNICHTIFSWQFFFRVNCRADAIRTETSNTLDGSYLWHSPKHIRAGVIIDREGYINICNTVNTNDLCPIWVNATKLKQKTGHEILTFKYSTDIQHVSGGMSVLLPRSILHMTQVWQYETRSQLQSHSLKQVSTTHNMKQDLSQSHSLT